LYVFSHAGGQQTLISRNQSQEADTAAVTTKSLKAKLAKLEHTYNRIKGSCKGAPLFPSPASPAGPAPRSQCLCSE